MSELPKQTRVLIIGGGPAGSLLALLLRPFAAILPVGAIAGEDTEMITASEPATEPLCLWRHEVDEKMWTSSLRAVDRGVAVANRSGTVCLRAHVDGERLWCVPVEGVANSRPTLFEAGDRIVVVTRDAITALDSRTGAQVWRQAGPWRRTVRGGDRLVAADLDVGDRFDRHRHAFQGIRPLDLERDRHHVEVQVLDLFEQREAQRGAAAHHVRASGHHVCGALHRHAGDEHLAGRGA